MKVDGTKEPQQRSTDVKRVAEASGLVAGFGWSTNVKMTGKSGAEHVFDLVLWPDGDESAKVAVLRGVSDDLVGDIMLFNARAADCGIKRKALSVERGLEATETNMARAYGIAVVDQRQPFRRESDIFGVKELDESLRGAMKKGNVYMVSGKTGTGKTTLATQFLVDGAGKGEKGAIILTDTKGAEFISNAKTFSFGFEKYRKEGTIEVIELTEKLKELKEDMLRSTKNGTDYINRLSSEMLQLVAESNLTRLVIDPITPMLARNDDFINRFFMRLAVPNAYVLVTSPSGQSDLSVYGIEEYLVSGVIKLETEDATTGIGKASIVKMRGSSYDPRPFYFRITHDGVVPSGSVDKASIDEIYRRV